MHATKKLFVLLEGGKPTGECLFSVAALFYANQLGRPSRLATVLWYLSDVTAGGETWFPRFDGAEQPQSLKNCAGGLKITPTKGRVVLFYSLSADGGLNDLSLHGSCPVVAGTKWAANKWVWNIPMAY